MEQSLLIFESSPLYLFLCAAFAFALSWYFYRRGKTSWSKRVNYYLLVTRWILTFLLTALLLSPILKYIQNQIEKPLVVVALDNSQSIKEVLDSTRRTALMTSLEKVSKDLEDNGYESRFITFDGELDNISDASFEYNSSNLSSLIKQVENRFEGRNLQSMILVSDGLYNSGASPIYSNYGFDLYTVGIGDSIPKQDISIQNVKYNKVSYQGNKFPVQVSILNEGYTDQATSLILRRGSEVLDTRQISFNKDQDLIVIDFLIDANTEGTQRFTVSTPTLDGEFTTANNIKTFFVDVVEGKEEILLISERPHPDIKALRSAIESNPNYSFSTYIRGIDVADFENKNFDLVICHQCTGQEGYIQALDLKLEETPLWVFFGKQMSISAINQTQLVVFQSMLNEFDVVTPAFNSGFTGFEYSDELRQLMRELPPLAVPFGDISNEFETESLLFQRVGSIETPKPLMVVTTNEPRRALLLGEGLWRWKLHDYLRNENNVLFTELVSKIVQYLSTREDKQKLRVFPTKNEFNERRAIIETEIYNDLYEQIYDIPVTLKLRNEQGEIIEYTYAISSANSRYQINGLESGVYTYTASASIGDELHSSNGQFIINEQQLEFLSLTADFRLLRNLATENGGNYYSLSDIEQIEENLNADNAKGVIHSYEAYDPLINLPWLLAILLLLASSEWFVRKYFGVY